jgi:hypothetical protein
MRDIRRALVAVMIASLAACGSNNDGGDATPTPATRDGTDNRSLVELMGELDNVGCSLSEVDPTEGYDIYEQAACSDGSIVLYRFTTTAARDDVVDGITGIEGEYAVVGRLWVVETKSRADATTVRRALGGVVRS